MSADDTHFGHGDDTASPPPPPPPPPPPLPSHDPDPDDFAPGRHEPYPDWAFSRILGLDEVIAYDDQAEDVYRAPPVPYSTGFFDHILDPARLDHGRYSPSAWRPYSPFAPEMPPTTRAHPQGSQRPDRLANGYVDLTSTPDTPSQTRKRDSTTPGPSAKRQKREDGTAKAATQRSVKPEHVDEVDVTEKSPVQEVLQKQREDAVKAQAKPEETVTTFNSFNCVICMDNPTDLTATACGHLFCHMCLMEALIAGENRTGPHETKRSQCPVCRKNISRNRSTDVIPLLLKKGLSTQPRKKKVVAPAVSTGPKVS